MFDALSLAASNVNASANRYAISAAELTKASLPGSQNSDSMAGAIAGMKMASDEFQANLGVLKAANNMMGTLLDIKA